MDLRIQSKLITKPHSSNSLLEAGLILVIIILVFFFLVRPKLDQNKAKASELTDAQSQLKSVEGDRQTMEGLIAKLKNNKTDVTLLDQALPLNGRITSLDLLLNNLVATSGMQLASIGNDEGSSNVVAGDKKLLSDPYGAERKLQTSNVTLSVTGPIDQFNQLLILIENSPRLLDIDSISITSGQDTVLYKVHVKGYYYAPEPPKSDPNNPTTTP